MKTIFGVGSFTVFQIFKFSNSSVNNNFFMGKKHTAIVDFVDWEINKSKIFLR